MTQAAAKCPICSTRKPKRYCPAKDDNICAVCCGREREVSIRCPLSCEHLREARKHEPLNELDPKTVPHMDVELTERFLQEHGALGQFLGEALWAAIAAEPSVIDADVREALDALTRTYRTLESGLVYETRPANPYAAAIAAAVRDRVRRLEEELQRQSGMAQLRDREVLGMLVFFQRTELQVNNNRPLGRAFIDVLRQNHQGAEGEPAPAPEEPGTGSLLAG